VTEEETPSGTSNEKLPDFCHSEFPSIGCATVWSLTLVVSENVLVSARIGADWHSYLRYHECLVLFMALMMSMWIFIVAR
jgi:hypothetical protein